MIPWAIHLLQTTTILSPVFPPGVRSKVQLFQITYINTVLAKPAKTLILFSNIWYLFITDFSGSVS